MPTVHHGANGPAAAVRWPHRRVANAQPVSANDSGTGPNTTSGSAAQRRQRRPHGGPAVIVRSSGTRTRFRAQPRPATRCASLDGRIRGMRPSRAQFGQDEAVD
jgi:hypothetical protein